MIWTLRSTAHVALVLEPKLQGRASKFPGPLDHAPRIQCNTQEVIGAEGRSVVTSLDSCVRASHRNANTTVR